MLNKILLLSFFFVFNHINCLASGNDVFISKLNIDDPNIKTKFIIMENTDFAFAPPLFIKEKKITIMSIPHIHTYVHRLIPTKKDYEFNCNPYVLYIGLAISLIMSLIVFDSQKRNSGRLLSSIFKGIYTYMIIISLWLLIFEIFSKFDGQRANDNIFYIDNATLIPVKMVIDDRAITIPAMHYVRKFFHIIEGKRKLCIKNSISGDMIECFDINFVPKKGSINIINILGKNSYQKHYITYD